MNTSGNHPLANRFWRCRLAALMLSCVAVLSACSGGGGGADDGSPAPPGNGGGGGVNLPSGGYIVVEDGSSLAVIDLATKLAVTVPSPSTNFDPGLGVSRNGLIADVNSDFGGGDWRIDIRSLDLNIVNSYAAGSQVLLSSSTSAAALNVDATRIAYSVNEMASEIDDTRIDRTYVYELATGNLLATFDEMSEPVFIDNGELLMRNTDDQLQVTDAGLGVPVALPLFVAPTFGAFSASPDGRYIAYEDSTGLHSQITVFDRTTGNSWIATSTPILRCVTPVFSPDGKWLAFLLGGSSAGTWLHIIPFEAGATTIIEEYGATEFHISTGDAVWVSSRYGWSN
jgi:hypothetical protein